MPKKIHPNKIIFMAIVIVIAAGAFIWVISGITHSFDVLNAPTPEHK